jgi:hypothetical protein
MATTVGVILGILAFFIVALPFLSPKIFSSRVSPLARSKQRSHRIERLYREIASLDSDRDLGFVDLGEYDERRLAYRLALANLLREGDEELQAMAVVGGSFEEQVHQAKRSGLE